MFSVKGFEALFPRAGTLGCTVCLTSQLFFLVCLHANVGPPVHQPLPCHVSSLLGCPSPPLLLVFFNSLVIGRPYSSIFCQLWLLFVFKFVLSFLCKETHCVYLCLHLGRKSLSLHCDFLPSSSESLSKYKLYSNT